MYLRRCVRFPLVRAPLLFGICDGWVRDAFISADVLSAEVVASVLIKVDWGTWRGCSNGQIAVRQEHSHEWGFAEVSRRHSKWRNSRVKALWI